MSDQITTAFVQQYKSGVELLTQQKGSRLRMAVRVETGIVGKRAYFDQISSTAARRRTTRHADTPLIPTPHTRRAVDLEDYDWADLIDQEDKVRTLNEMTSPYQMNAAMAMGRAMDDAIIAAATGDALTGESGGTTESFDTSGFQIAAASAGLTVAKLIEAKEKLDAAENDPDEPRFVVCKAEHISDLLNTTEVKSADYNTVKTLVEGKVDTFLGFKFIRSERILTSSTNDRVLAFGKSAILLAVGRDVTARVSERDDKNYATQVFFGMTIGATRMRANGIVDILCA